MGGRVSAPPTPAVFNTGQVLLGWVALHRATGDEVAANAAARAARWLVRIQSDDGAWRRHNSMFARPSSTLYNARVAWALAAHGTHFGDRNAVDAAIRNGRYTMTRQRDNGWFAECCLNDPSRPLLHTLAYTARGLLELGRITGEEVFVQSARKSADALIRVTDPAGFIPGRIDAGFRPVAKWACLTGSAQTSIIWSVLHRMTGEPRYRDAAKSVNRYLMERHDVSSPDDALRGGVPGSWPVHGEYGRLMILNWATKFFVDALLGEDGIEVTG